MLRCGHRVLDICGATLLAFATRDMRLRRTAALGANLCFIAEVSGREIAG